MLVVFVGINKCHRDRQNFVIPNFLGDCIGFGARESAHNLPLHIHSLIHRITITPFDDGFGLDLIGIVEQLAMLAPNLDGVAKTLGGHHRGIGIIAFDKCVSRRGRAVHDMRDFGKRDPRLTNGTDNPQGAVLAGGQHFGRDLRARGVIPCKKVRKGSANVDSNPPHRPSPVLVV